MEGHPVPHNVLEIEFKLFGNFSVRQFARILLGCGLALGVYMLNIPAIISIPVIVITIGLGIGSAMVPRFDAKLATLFNAVIISPRYVWRKATPQTAAQAAKSAKQAQAKSAGKQVNVITPKIGDLEIDALIQARSQRRAVENTSNDPLSFNQPSTNFDQTFQQIYADQPQAQPTTAAIPEQPVKAPTPAPVNIDPVTATEELVSLKGKLLSLQKQNAPAAEITALRNRIDYLYQQLKENSPSNTPTAATVQAVRPTGNYLYGIVVDKGDQPLASVNVQVVGADGNVYANAISQADGRFETSKSLPEGEYVIEVVDSIHKFDKFKVTISQQKLPAYKFRAR
jgi:hypothetical protein